MVIRKKTFRRRSFKRVASRRKRMFRRRRQPFGTLKVLSLGAPTELFVKLPYVETVTSGDVATFVFHQYQSSLFDPNLTGTGHQPRYFDEWAAMFNRYQVLGMKAIVEFIQIDSSASPVSCAIAWSENTNAYLTTDDLSETKYGKKVTLQGQGSRTVAVLKSYMSAKTIHGNRKGPLQQDDQQALVSANPTDMFFLNIGHQTVDGTTTTNIYKRVKIIYYARLFDQKDPGSS